MYEEHPVFVQPEDESIKIWRYMDFTKFVSLIDSRRLYFTRADKFDDPFEGSWPKVNVAARASIPAGIPEDSREAFAMAMQQSGEINRHWPRYKAINCWHMNEFESAAMWNLYLQSNEGISIQSTYSKLKKSFIDDEQIFLGKVNYIDYDSEFIDAGNVLGPFVHKRKSFEHEKEVRALISKWPVTEHGLDFNKETIGHGVPVKIDIETLVEKVYVAPSAPQWFVDLVQGIVTRYGYKFEVVQSRLNESPVF